jgi:hypothetical protein
MDASGLKEEFLNQTKNVQHAASHHVKAVS